METTWEIQSSNDTFYLGTYPRAGGGAKNWVAPVRPADTNAAPKIPENTGPREAGFYASFIFCTWC